MRILDHQRTLHQRIALWLKELGQDRAMNPRNLAALSNSIFSSLGVAGAKNELGIEVNPDSRECLLLIDGMGAQLIEQFGAQFPIFSQLRELGNLKSHFPSTTATNLSSLGTGVLPGIHGMLGYTVRVPRSGEPGRLLNSLKWDERVDPLVWQKVPTLFQRAADQGIRVSHIAAKRYEGSGFTQAALRGAQYLGANQLPEIIENTVEAMGTSPSFSYVYINNLDHAGHEEGVGSEKWLSALAFVAELITGLRDRLPKGTRLWVTADHGMVNVGEKIILGQENSLMENVTLVGGEPRARHIYVREGAMRDTAAIWREFLGEKASIYTREEAIAHQLFGAETLIDSQERMGDVVVVAKSEMILIDPERIKEESKMVGHHGGLEEVEVEVPLLTHQR
jgi:predicted AlkP superfamily pyrophosphatase or phosphodiesterase